jgi:hypothetical protein
VKSDGGERRIRTFEGIRRQIYSLIPLATWVSLQLKLKTCPSFATPAGQKPLFFILVLHVLSFESFDRYFEPFRLTFFAIKFGTKIGFGKHGNASTKAFSTGLKMELEKGIEPTTCGLQNRCSTN